MPPWPLIEAMKGSAEGIDVVTLVAFCNEGDNIPDAAAMAQLTADFLKLQPDEKFEEIDESPTGQQGHAPSLQWRMPPSWAHLYGPPPEAGLF